MSREFTSSSISALFAATIGMCVGATPILSATTSLFILPISQEFGLSRASFTALLLIAPWTAALLSTLTGLAIDRFGIRKVALPGVLVFGASQFLMAQAHQIWQLALFILIAGLSVTAHSQSAYTKIASLWFDRHRGLAIGLIVALGTGLGGALVPQLAHYLIEADGWRSAYIGMSCLILVVGFPILFFLLREPPVLTAPGGKLRLSDEGLSFAQAARTRTFWTITILLTITPFAVGCTSTHLFPMLSERGISPTIAASALSLVYLGGMTGQLLIGVLMDRFGTPRVALPFFMAAAAGVAVLGSAGTVGLVLPGAFLLGLGQGSELGIAAYMVGRYFGLKAFGAIFGLILGTATFGFGAGMVLMGWIHDTTGGYGLIRPVLIGLLFCSLILVVALKAYPGRRKPDAEPAEGAAQLSAQA